MQILALQKDKLHLTKISLSNGEEVLIGNDVCRDNYLKKGDELSEEKLNALVFESQYQRAKSRAVWYLDRKDRTAKDLYNKLQVILCTNSTCMNISFHSVVKQHLSPDEAELLAVTIINHEQLH